MAARKPHCLIHGSRLAWIRETFEYGGVLFARDPVRDRSLIELALGHGVVGHLFEQQPVEPHNQTGRGVAEYEAPPPVEVKDAVHAAAHRARNVSEHLPQTGPNGEEAGEPRQQGCLLVRAEETASQGARQDILPRPGRLQVIDGCRKGRHCAASTEKQLARLKRLAILTIDADVRRPGHLSILPSGSGDNVRNHS